MSFRGECGTQSGPPPTHYYMLFEREMIITFWASPHPVLSLWKKYHLLKCMHIKRCLIFSSTRFLHLLVLLCLLLLSSSRTDNLEQLVNGSYGNSQQAKTLPIVPLFPYNLISVWFWFLFFKNLFSLLLQCFSVREREILKLTHWTSISYI